MMMKKKKTTNQAKTTAEKPAEEIVKETVETAKNEPDPKASEASTEAPQPEAEAPKDAAPEQPQTPPAGEAAAGTGEAAVDWNEKYVRLYAEFQNFRKRTERDKNAVYSLANERFALGLLDVLDNFERAMEHAQDSTDPRFVGGMQLILRQMSDFLERNGVREIEALGKQFDPNFHNAVMTDWAEGAESGTITRVLQKGYTLNNKVIRPSMVAVVQ